jgi:AraC-like DNA-binding protein
MIALPRALLDAPLPESRSPVVAEPVGRQSRSAPAGDFVASIRQAIETLSCRAYPDIRTTAEFVGMSVRTLQRRRANAGVSHHMLVAQTRFATAAAVLEETDAKVLDLALDLGYSDHGNFTRAFRRWAGCAPRQYRSRHAPRRGTGRPVRSSARGGE